MQDPLTLQETAALIAGHVRLEEELFRVTGFWSGDGSESGAGGAGPPAQAFFAAESAHHGWRSEQWEVRRVRSVDPAAEPADRLVHAVAATLEDGLTPVERLAVWGHVFAPSLAARYGLHRRALAPASDGGLDRWLGICITDLARGTTEAVGLAAELGEPAGADSLARVVGRSLARVHGS